MTSGAPFEWSGARRRKAGSVGRSTGWFRARTRVLSAAVLVLCGVAAASAVALATAEWEFRTDVPVSTARAARIGNVQYHERLAELEEHNGAAHLRNAVKANPRAAATWIALGLVLERNARVQAGNGEAVGATPARGRPAREAMARETRAETFAPEALEKARQALERAARADRQYLPAWTLANFAFRHGDAATFWRAARRAAALAYDHRQPLIELADRMEREPAVALDRLEAGAPFERDYLDFLIAERRLDDALKVARRILARVSGSLPQSGEESAAVFGTGVAHGVNHVQSVSGDAMRLADFTSRLLESQHPREAIEMWSGLGGFPKTGGGLALTNGDFQQVPSGLGFDWKPVAADGVHASWRPHTMQFELSGAQPEVCALLEQWVVTTRQRRRLSFDFSWRGTAPEPPANSGLRWAWVSSPPPASPATQVEALMSPPLDPASEWRPASWEFMPPTPGAHRLRLIYRREPGGTRASGKLLLRHLRLDVVPEPTEAKGAL